MQGRIKVLKDVDKSNILPMTHAKAVYVDEENTLDKTLNNIESQIIQQRKTYAELKELIENNKLIPGTQYVLIDYRTKYQQPTTNVIKEIEVEELILTASSVNTFEPVVYSTKYHSDTIWYDFDNNLCEDKTTERNGFILRRYDPVTGNDAPQDWRSMLWARYKPHPTSYIANGSQRDYVYHSANQPAMMGYIYKAGNKLWVAKNTNVPTSATDTAVFFEIYPDLNTPLLTRDKTKIAPGIELLKGDLVEVPTFGAGCAENIIESTSSLHDNVFISVCSRNYLGQYCIRNSFSGTSNTNTLQKYAYDNIFIEAQSNFFGNWLQ
ncbi:hypothetical protein [Clostridium sp. Marseille-Q7071]